MRPLPLISLRACRALVTALVLSGAGVLRGQETDKLSPPPDFSQGSIGAAADEVAAAWTRWWSGDKGLEQQIFRQPMGEGRNLLQRRLGAFLHYMDKRRAYSESVRAYLDGDRTKLGPGQPAVPRADVYQDQMYELRMHLAALRERLSTLRDRPEWTQVRRDIQPEIDLAFKLQSSRRSEMPFELPLGDSRAPATVTSFAYWNLDQQFMDQLNRLWTRYYQTLADALEQKSGGAAPLTSIGRPDSAAPADHVPGSDSAAHPPANPLVGVWTYPESSKRFNAVDEPSNVLLELWIENGLLLGRYRADLPDFRGSKRVDLRLRGHIASAGATQTMEFESKAPPGTGQIVLEGPSGGGMEVMLDRRVPSGSAIPRGREVLRRR